jgi:hypothetical protein
MQSERHFSRKNRWVILLFYNVFHSHLPFDWLCLDESINRIVEILRKISKDICTRWASRWTLFAEIDYNIIVLNDIVHGKYKQKDGYRFVSFDVKSLFTHVPGTPQENINIIRDRIYNGQQSNTTLKKRTLKKLLLDLCTKTPFSIVLSFCLSVSRHFG